MLDTTQIQIECCELDWNDDPIRLEITVPRKLLENKTVERMSAEDWVTDEDLKLIGLLDYLTCTYGFSYGTNLLMLLFMSMDIERGGQDGGATAVIRELEAEINDLKARFSSEG